MGVQARDSYLKNLPDSTLYARQISRIRQKGFHAESKPGEGNELDASAVYLVDPLRNPVSVFQTGIAEFSLDNSAGNDKQYVVPEGEEWEILGIFAWVSTDVNVGNRTYQAQIYPDGATTGTPSYRSAIFAAHVAASSVFYQMFPTAPVSEVGTQRWHPMPSQILPAGALIRFYDVANIAVGDAVRVRIHYKLRYR